MNKLLLFTLALLSFNSASVYANAITIKNDTLKTIKVGLYASFGNFATRTAKPGEIREYDTGIASECVKKISIDDVEVWSGTKCENYTVTITKNADNTYALAFGPSLIPNRPAMNPSQGLSID